MWKLNMRFVRTQNSPVWTTRGKRANHGTVCLGIKQLLGLSYTQTTLIFEGNGQKEGICKAERWGAASAFSHQLSSHHQNYTLSTRQQLRNPLTAKTPTQMFVPFWANPVSSWEVSYTGNGNLQWLRTPWVTATISSQGERGLKLQQDQREKGLCPSERIFSLLTSPLPKSVTPKSPQSFLVSVNSDSHSTDICA